MKRASRTLIVGGGMAGMAAAIHLHRGGHEVTVLEAGDAPGGRVRTDEVEGFRLDRGFQVLLTAYPEAQRLLHYPSLDLRKFLPGAVVWRRRKRHYLIDPWRQPLEAMRHWRATLGTWEDRMRILWLRWQVTRKGLHEIFSCPDESTRDFLRGQGFSEEMIESFFAPFYRGIFLEPGLETSRRMFEFTFRMFSLGGTALPARGIGAISEHLASQLPAGTIRLQTPVQRVDSGAVTLENGEVWEADHVVLATDAQSAHRLNAQVPERRWNRVVCLYYASEQAPEREPILVLNGEGEGPVNNLVNLSRVSPDVAPRGQELISVSVINPATDLESTEQAVREQLSGWYGSAVEGWRLLRTYDLPLALPRQSVGAEAPGQRPVKVDSGLFVCGDHREHSSLQGALRSGRRAAEALLNDFTPSLSLS